MTEDSIDRIVGRTEGKVDTILKHVTMINGHLKELYARTEKNSRTLIRHAAAIRQTQGDVGEAKTRRSTWAQRAWKAFVGLALVVIGYLLKS